jgi:uncharacterized protein YaaQ
MKLLMAIVRDDHAPAITSALNQAGMAVTHISSTGGFWRRGNTTLLIGLDDQDIDQALRIVNANAGPEIEPSGQPEGRQPHRATVFVINVGQFEQY